MQKRWAGKRYNNLNCFLRNKFGEKVFKISIDGGFSCPNRDGKISSGGCIFCSERGSGDFAGDRRLSISNQFEDVKAIMNKKWAKGKYIAYFQAYTNTYAPIDILRKKYKEALTEEGVVGLAIATRPDCLDDDVISLLEEMSKETYLWVELGLQTSKDETAKCINRGYNLEVFEDAIKRLREKNIDVVVHTIFGLPDETEEDMLNTIRYISSLDIQGIKFHLLHLMKDTELLKLYESGGLEFLNMEQYVRLVSESIAILPESVVIHRLTGDSPRDLLVGPMWSLNKWEILNSIDAYLEREDIYQGLYYSTNTLQ
ncbi:TIGR01212 family radical SAM protein [Clostridium algidicarnis]|uniref:TIGR01212 family radical SAM protein n=1 Tax=Clostridium algidicarnis TaxID=37659 RepID=A0ABS6C0K8_9CLOT|nr:TIGR01212 family radical SAM protein [Clostridium algidicarnis]MBU3219026.1 TIGR01212 family radical SAM protein [Clostridium algidicarnis]